MHFEDGYVMPAEWENHEATWISWPKNSDSFPDEILPEVERTYMSMISALHKNEKVHLLVDGEDDELRVSSLLESIGIGTSNVFFHKIRTEDVWFRDFGPIFVTKRGQKERGIYAIHWDFNAWGGKYEELKKDTQIPEKLPLGGIPTVKVNTVLEGGSIDVNGSGSCITTEQCLLNKNRNADLNKKQIEELLAKYLGAENVIWLKAGITGDDTDGHIDDVARFVSRDTVVCASEGNPDDENYLTLKENLGILEKAKDQDGNSLNVVTLPMPEAVVYNGQRLPASYTNFYIANKVVLVPTFNDPKDKDALDIIQGLFPGRKAIGINCRELVYGFGAIHCVTQQQPQIT